MKITGDINQIKNKRDSNNTDIQIAIDAIAYITHIKDGRYFQPFEFIQNLPNPVLLTGDQLARKENKYLAANEFEFNIYDKVAENYYLNPAKQLLITTEFDFDTAETIITAITYTITVSPADYKKLKSQTSTTKAPAPGKNRRKK